MTPSDVKEHNAEIHAEWEERRKARQQAANDDGETPTDGADMSSA